MGVAGGGRVGLEVREEEVREGLLGGAGRRRVREWGEEVGEAGVCIYMDDLLG